MTEKIRIWLLIASSVFLTVSPIKQTSQQLTPQVIRTSCGEVTGRASRTPSETNMFEFHNIPYATPPVGARRFAAPRLYNKHNLWKGPVDATEERVVECVQGGYTQAASGSEDCLVMSIRTTNVTVSKPVVVWLHGGGLFKNFCCLKGYSFDSHLTEIMDAVTVNINFRLGFLGFHSIEELWDREKGVVANNGIRDIITALRWVNDNIGSFGGDPNSVTLLGHSAGATAALAVVSSPLAVNLFHRVIALSPAPETRFSYVSGSRYQKSVYNVIRETGCEKAANKRQCLQNLPAEALTMHDHKFNPSGRLSRNHFLAYFDFPTRYGKEPVCAGLIVTDPFVVTQAPKNLAVTNFGSLMRSKVQIILSNTIHENSYISFIHPINTFTDYTILNKTLEDLIPNVTARPVTEVMDEIYGEYSSLPPQLIWDTLTTDMRSTCPTNEVGAAMALSQHHDVRRLFFTYTPPFMPAFHGLEVEALFGYHFMGPYIPESVKVWQFRQVVVDLIKSFVRDGSVSFGWGTFPSSSMTIDNSESMVNISTAKPSEKWCEKLRDLEFLKYGWQN